MLRHRALSLDAEVLWFNRLGSSAWAEIVWATAWAEFEYHLKLFDLGQDLNHKLFSRISKTQISNLQLVFLRFVLVFKLVFEA